MAAKKKSTSESRYRDSLKYLPLQVWHFDGGATTSRCSD